jgi:hypothetical protein
MGVDKSSILMKGYLESLIYSERVSNHQKDVLINKIEDLITEIESDYCNQDEDTAIIEIAIWLKGYKTALENGEQLYKKQIEVLLGKIDEIIEYSESGNDREEYGETKNFTRGNSLKDLKDKLFSSSDTESDSIDDLPF